jgi:predicted signal transduction protein with EAL and GGDEF domain
MGKRLVGKLVALISVPSDNPRLLTAQFIALARQLPMMYMVLLINTWALAFTHWDSAPGWLTLVLPVVLTFICGARSVMWWRMAGHPPPPPVIVAMLTRTNRLAIFIAIGFTAWSLALYPYGGAYAQAHVAFYMGITVIVCIFCMMHLLTSALITTTVVNVAFVVFFASTRNPTFIATAINIVLVSIALLVVLQNNYRNFMPRPTPSG